MLETKQSTKTSIFIHDSNRRAHFSITQSHVVSKKYLAKLNEQQLVKTS